MQTKKKICNGNGLAKGYGCGKESYKRKYGICDECLYSWYTTNEVGKIMFERLKIKNKKKSDNAFKSDLRQKLKTVSDYAKELQKEVNTIVRLIDKGTQCISTLKPLNDKYDAGHFYSVGSNPALRFNLHNIHAQSVYANQYLSGDQMNYLNGLSKVYGEDYKNYVVNLKSRYKVLKLNKDEYVEKIKIAKSIIHEINYDKLKFDYVQIFNERARMYLRKHYNQRLGIYEE